MSIRERSYHGGYVSLPLTIQSDVQRVQAVWVVGHAAVVAEVLAQHVQDSQLGVRPVSTGRGWSDAVLVAVEEPPPVPLPVQGGAGAAYRAADQVGVVALPLPHLLLLCVRNRRG